MRELPGSPTELAARCLSLGDRRSRQPASVHTATPMSTAIRTPPTAMPAIAPALNPLPELLVVAALPGAAGNAVAAVLSPLVVVAGVTTVGAAAGSVTTTGPVTAATGLAAGFAAGIAAGAGPGTRTGAGAGVGASTGAAAGAPVGNATPFCRMGASAKQGGCLVTYCGPVRTACALTHASFHCMCL